MKHSKEEKLAYLFDEIGGVDDAMLTEALQYRAKRERGAWRRTLLPIACTLFLCVTSLSVVSVNWDRWFPSGDIGGNEGADVTDGGSLNVDMNVGDDVQPDLPSDDTPAWHTETLDALLVDAKADGRYTMLSSVADIDYFGDAHLLWQYASDETVYQSRALTEREMERLCRFITGGDEVGSTSPTQIVRVWLVLGNGDVLTPYLPTTPGNIGTTVFDYEAERIPSDALISCISDILRP